MKFLGIISERQLDILKQYQRPMRAVLWAFCIMVTFLLCVTGLIPCEGGSVTETILYIMGADLGIYSVARSVEKVRISGRTEKEN